MSKPDAQLVTRAVEAAKQALSNAYAPYSHFRVSAALYLRDRDEIHTGVNIENVSFGGTICAERSAFAAAISKYGTIQPGLLVVYTDTPQPTPPCGICRQFVSEFVDPDFPVILACSSGKTEYMTMARLLPGPFADFTSSE